MNTICDDKKICKTCGVTKTIDQYQKSGKNRKGEIRYKSTCKECCKEKQTVQHRRDTQKLYHFNCKKCGKADSHYDERYTTFCSRECNYAYKARPNICSMCGCETKYGLKYCDKCKLLKKQYKRITENEASYKREKLKIIKVAERKVRKVKQETERKEKRETALNKICSMCNSPFKAKRRDAKTCDTCRYIKKLLRDISRGKRSKTALPKEFDRVDLDITHEKLIERDKNICYLCGKPCDSKHFIHDEKGSFIALDNYPSIDHIIALTNGGTHTWDNVKLAHMNCNNIKSDRTIDEAKAQLKLFL